MSFWPFLVLQLVIFGALVVVLRRVLSRNLLEATAHLQSLSAEYVRRQEELKQRLKEAEEQYTERLTRAKAEAGQLIVQARQEAESSKTKLLEEAHQESERVVRQGMETRDALRQELELAMEARAIERACELIQVALPAPIREGIQSRWIDELLQNGLTQLDRLRSDDQVQDGRVVSAFPLTAAQREALRKRLREQLGRSIELAEETDEHLVAGLTITLGSVVFDGSLASKVRQAARQAQQHAS